MMKLIKDGDYEYCSLPPMAEGEAVTVTVQHIKWRQFTGVSVRVQPIKISFSHGFRCCEMNLGIGGGKPEEIGKQFFVLPLARKSQKQISRIAAHVTPICEKVAELWRTDNLTAQTILAEHISRMA